MRYHPSTENEQREMLDEIGLESIDELFSHIPSHCRLQKSLELPAALGEWDLLDHLRAISASNKPVSLRPSFKGGGAYHHFIPSVVGALGSRCEFVTAYTPYQPEISQGTLQAIFEYQSMISILTDMPISNASVYDGAMAAAEAVLMAHRITRKPRIAVSRAVNPAYRKTIATYCENQSIVLEELPVTPEGITDLSSIEGSDAPPLAALVIQSPNYMGIVEDVKNSTDKAHAQSALQIVVVSEALSLAALTPPGSFGADIVCGEAQSFGLPLSLGGPYLGFLSCKEDFIRQIPGRLVGMTQDAAGRRGFVNTLSTREQHIRRERATSNICTNQALCAVLAGIYLSTMGKKGLLEAAGLNIRKTAYLKQRINALPDFTICHTKPTFNEFAVRVPGTVKLLNEKLSAYGFAGGIDLSAEYPELGQSMLLCATETVSSRTIDAFVDALNSAGKDLKQ